MQNNIVKEKSFAFALRVVLLYQGVKKKKKTVLLFENVLRSGTCIALEIRKSIRAETKEEFIDNASRALRYADETAYWLELLFHAGCFKEKFYLSLTSDCNELINLLTNSLKTSRQVLA